MFVLGWLVGCGADGSVVHDAASVADAGSPDGAGVADAGCVFVAPPSCDEPIECPAPEPDHFTLCGELRDLQTGAAIGDGTACRCGAGGDPEGACSVRISVNSSLDPALPALPAEESVVDRCGRFRISNVPASQYLPVLVLTRPSVGDSRLPTTIFLQPPQGAVSGVIAYSTRGSTDLEWTSSAGFPFGDATFAEKGVYVLLFREEGVGVPGVRATRGGAVVAGDDFYFASTAVDLSVVDSSADATGPNGAALMVNSALGQHSGTGGLTPPCTWSSELGTSIPGVVYVHEVISSCASE